MKVTPEIYAWLTNLNVIKPHESISHNFVKDFIVPEKTVSSLFLGKYMDIIIQPLQDEFNKFYDKDENYILNLINLQQIPESKEYISNPAIKKIKEENWKIIFEVLFNFGVKFDETEINLLVNNDKNELNKVITKIYKAYTKLSNSLTKYKKNKSKQEILNINDLDSDKNYYECNTLLEFIILSISKNMNLNMRQSVALLSNNRKYLKKICTYGYIFDFQMLKNWLNDFEENKSYIIQLIINSEDGLNIFYETIGTVLYCKDLDISLQAAQLLNIIKKKIKMNWKWFYNEGINAYIFIFNKENCFYKKVFMKSFGELISGESNFFFDEIKKKFYAGEKKLIYDFLSNIINDCENMEHDFKNNLQIFIFEICLSKINDKSYNLSMLSDTFYNFIPIEGKIINNILSYFKYCIKSDKENISSTGICQIFNLMQRLGKIKNKYAPQLYKIIVNLFLETYDNIIKRELFLENFEKFFNENQDIPIDILFEKYLNKINSCQNYSLCDFLFLLKMVEHPRIEGKDISEIIQFILYVCLYNLIYTRCANLILSLIFEKKLITNNPNDKEELKSQIIPEIENQFVNFINNSLEIYISNIFKKEDKFILETPYEIMTQNFKEVNLRVKNKLINCVKKYRHLKDCHSSGLLAMLWYYSDHDDIMMQIEEMNRPIYEPMSKYLERNKIKQKEKEEKSYTKRVIIYLNKLTRQKLDMAKQRQLIYDQEKMRQEKIKKRLNEYRKVIKYIPGHNNRLRPIILEKNQKLTRNTSSLYDKSQDLISDQISPINDQFKNSKNLSKLSRSQSYSYLNHIYESNNERDIIKQYKVLLNAQKKKKYRDKATDRKWIKNILIRKEDTVIRQELYSRNRKFFFDPDIFIKCLSLPFDLDEEEDRELEAIKGYNVEYKKNLVHYFKIYSYEAKQKISKMKFIKFLRDIDFNNERIEYNEINILIRLMFKYNLSEFDFNQFINILIQLSYIIFSRMRPCLTIGEAYGNLLKRLVIKKINQKHVEYLQNKYESVMRYILQLKRSKEPFNMPEGFKIVKKTTVKYNYGLATHMIEYLGEARLICYELIEEIIFSCCNSSFIEPYIDVNDIVAVDIEPEKVHNWSARLTMAYMDLDPSLQFHGMFAADALEDGIRRMLKKNYEESLEGNIMRYTKKICNMKWAKEDISKKHKLHIRIEEENEKIKNNQIEPENNKYHKTISNKDYNLVKVRFKKIKIDIEENKKKKKEEEEQRLKDEIKLEEVKKEQNKIINKECRKKLNVQLKNIMSKKERLRKERNEEEQKEINKNKRKDYIICEQDKQYNEFEKNLSNSIKKMMEKEEIKAVIDKYINHLKAIYDVYSQLSINKIGSKQVIRLDDFNQFLVNFTILGVYISLEQMNWIFKNISKLSQRKRNNDLYLDFEDFKLSICYLTIFSSLEIKSWKLKPNNIEEITEENLEKFFSNLGLKLPFNKVELDKFINERRTMPTKNLLNIQQTKRREEKKNSYTNMGYLQNEEYKANSLPNKYSKKISNTKQKNKIILPKKEEKGDNINNLQDLEKNNNINNNINKVEEKEEEEEKTDNKEEKGTQVIDEKNKNEENNINKEKEKENKDEESSEESNESSDSDEEEKKEEKKSEKVDTSEKQKNNENNINKDTDKKNEENKDKKEIEDTKKTEDKNKIEDKNKDKKNDKKEEEEEEEDEEEEEEEDDE